MDRYVYNALSRYFHTLETVGYMPIKDIHKLLVLVFIYKMAYGIYRTFVTRKDYHDMSRALNCLYGCSCLLPYPDYAKTGILKLGGFNNTISETRALEIYEQELNQRIAESARVIAENTSRIDSHDEQLANIENTRVIKGNNYIQSIPTIDLDALDQGGTGE